MNKSDFSELSLEQKSKIVFRDGLRITAIVEGRTHATLYLLNNFFVEVQYSVDRGIISSVELVKDDGKLERYLKSPS